MTNLLKYLGANGKKRGDMFISKIPQLKNLLNQQSF